MRVCPDDSSKKKAWRECMVVTWKQGSILYAVGCTHTIDGQGDRKLPTKGDIRISGGRKGPCINAGLTSPRSDSESSWGAGAPGPGPRAPTQEPPPLHQRRAHLSEVGFGIFVGSWGPGPRPPGPNPGTPARRPRGPKPPRVPSHGWLQTLHRGPQSARSAPGPHRAPHGATRPGARSSARRCSTR